MRALLSVLLLLALAVPGAAQGKEPLQAPPASGEGGKKEGGDESKGEEKDEAEAPAEEEGEEEANPPAEEKPAEEPEAEAPPAWTMPERDAKKFGDLLESYFRPGKRVSRQEILEKFAKLLEKDIDGHSALEDVAGITALANAKREFHRKINWRGKVKEHSVAPDVHGFPIGTVTYWLYLPKDYSDKQLYPLIFCMPDNGKNPDGRKYIRDTWVSNPAVAEKFLVVCPQPEIKGEDWTREKSMARAMIALRHCIGTFDLDKNNAGPATDTLRVFVHGGDVAALVAARYPEVFAGAILENATGRLDATDVGRFGQLSGLPAFLVSDKKQQAQSNFAARVHEANKASSVVDQMDATAVGEWLLNLPVHDAQPHKLSYAVHDGTFQRHYWINVLQYDAAVKPAPSFSAVVRRADNEIQVSVEGISRFELFLNDALLDLNKDVRIVVDEGEGKEYEFFKGKVERSLPKMLDELVASNHPWRVYPVRFVVDVPVLRERAAAAAAADPG